MWWVFKFLRAENYHLIDRKMDSYDGRQYFEQQQQQKNQNICSQNLAFRLIFQINKHMQSEMWFIAFFWVVHFGGGSLSVLFFLKCLSLNTNPNALECNIPYIPWYWGSCQEPDGEMRHCFKCLSSYEMCQIAWP